MTSSKSDKIILWGGKENTLIPQANTKKIKEENALFEKRISLEAELEATEQKINQIKEKGLKYEINVSKELKEQAKIQNLSLLELLNSQFTAGTKQTKSLRPCASPANSNP